jgi:hypothetical protein
MKNASVSVSFKEGSELRNVHHIGGTRRVVSYKITKSELASELQQETKA